MICKNCNRENNDNANFCSFCGNSLSKNEYFKTNLNDEEFEEIVYFDPHDDDDFSSNEQENSQYFEFEEDNSDYDDCKNYRDKQGNNHNKKIMAFILVIILVLIAVFLASKIEFLKNDEEEASVSSEETIDSQEDNKIQNDNSKEDKNSQSKSSSDEDSQKINQEKTYEGNKNNEIGALYIKNTECSSILHDSTNKDYGSTRVLDGDFSTVWSEGVSGYGKGGWIRLDFDSIRTVKKIKIVNGLVNKKNGYYNNNRPKSLVLRFSDGSSQVIYLEDDNTGYQVVDIDTVDTSYIKFTIESVYYGSKYNDTCIADIEVLGY